MNERKARRLLMPYLDSELDARTTAEITEYLETSDDARRRFDAEAGLEAWIAESLRDERMSDDTWRNIQLRLGVIRPPMWPKVVAAAAVVVLALVGWYASTIEWNAVLRELGVRHRAFADGGYVLEIETERKREVVDWLAEQGLEGVPVVPTRGYKKHEIQLLGAGHDELLGVPSVVLAFRCCGEPVSVFVLSAEAAAALPDALVPKGKGAREKRSGALQIETLRRDDHVLAVVSRASGHSSQIAALL